MAESISKSERDELRRIVRGDFKALSMELEARRAEVLADIEQRVAQRFAPNDRALADAEAKIAVVVAEANRQIAVVVDDLQENCDGYDISASRFAAPYVEAKPTKRHEMRRALIAELDAEIAQAKVKMARGENDLLRNLASDAIESSKAREFLAAIPKVGELVPMVRMAELEAQFHQEDQPLGDDQ